MEKLKDFLKVRLRVAGISLFFYMVTTTISVIMIYIPTIISDKIYLPIDKLGAVILGSIFGQVTILIAIKFMNWIFKDGFEDPERLELIPLIDIEA